jgi:FkbM family methyltransferase
MTATIKKFTPQVIRRVVRHIRRIWRNIKPFPHRITLTSLVSGGCKFEATTRVEEGRVVGLGDEEDFIRLLLAEIQPGDVFFDVGSCVGIYALHAAILGVRVVAFEPDPSYRRRLLKNIRLNKLQGRIQVVEWAVSDRTGTATLYTNGVEGRSPSLSQVGERSAVCVDTDSIDNAIADGRLPYPTMVKIDIEGAEVLALRGMSQLLSSQDSPRCLFIELHPGFLPGFGSSADECMGIIESFGYVREYFHSRAEQLHCIYRQRKAN